jgi:FtsZ-binding cell division protein ZapB
MMHQNEASLKYEHLQKEKTNLPLSNLPLNLAHNHYGLYSLSEPMNELLIERIQAKIVTLGESKLSLQQQVQRLREENEAMHRINKELQQQVDELSNRVNSGLNTGSMPTPQDENFRGVTRHRINELVKEIDECITLLNK